MQSAFENDLGHAMGSAETVVVVECKDRVGHTPRRPYGLSLWRRTWPCSGPLAAFRGRGAIREGTSLVAGQKAANIGQSRAARANAPAAITVRVHHCSERAPCLGTLRTEPTWLDLDNPARQFEVAPAARLSRVSEPAILAAGLQARMGCRKCCARVDTNSWCLHPGGVNVWGSERHTHCSPYLTGSSRRAQRAQCHLDRGAGRGWKRPPTWQSSRRGPARRENVGCPTERRGQKRLWTALASLWSAPETQPQ